MTFTQLKADLRPELRRMSKAQFVDFILGADGRVRVGESRGKDRITAKRARALLGV